MQTSGTSEPPLAHERLSCVASNLDEAAFHWVAHKLSHPGRSAASLSEMMWQRFPSSPPPPPPPPPTRIRTLTRRENPTNSRRRLIVCVRLAEQSRLKASKQPARERDGEQPASSMSCSQMDNGSANSAEAKKTDLRVNEKKCCK